MITLFVSDIDGCLAEPYQTYDLPRLQEIARCVAEAGPVGSHPVRPAFSLCSGRPYPYVEAMTQLLDVRVPVLFESGGGLFNPVTARTAWHPHFTSEVEGQIDAVRQWMKTDLLPDTGMQIDHTKRTQAGLVGPDEDEIRRSIAVVERFVEEHAPGFRVFHTPVSIDVVAPDVTKKQGLAWLAERLGLALDAVAYIGDTNGDLDALGAVGYPFAPANATEAVRRQARHVTTGAVADGTLEAYRWCAAHNEKVTAEKPAA